MKFSGIVPNNIIYHLKWFEQNRYCSFWEMVQKPPKNTVFLTWIIQKFFFRKKGSVSFLRISISNFWPKISKILRAVIQIWRWLTNKVTFPGLSSTEVENCNVLCTSSTSVFCNFFCKFRLILNNFAHKSGNHWLWSGVEQFKNQDFDFFSA